MQFPKVLKLIFQNCLFKYWNDVQRKTKIILTKLDSAQFKWFIYTLITKHTQYSLLIRVDKAENEKIRNTDFHMVNSVTYMNVFKSGF